ncbi:MAG: hypothetical protein ACRCXC_01945 [Legionella sp.]
MFFKLKGNPLTREIICSFSETYYPDESLTPQMLEQLSCIQNNSVITIQSNTQSKAGLINIEIKRALSRFYCLQLLKEGGTLAYTKFVQYKPQDVILSESNFDRLSQLIQHLTSSSQECLMATCALLPNQIKRLVITPQNN